MAFIHSTITVTNKANKRASAVVIKKDLKRDLALLKTNFVGKPVTFFDGQLKQGELVEALGHPKGRKFSLTKSSKTFDIFSLVESFSNSII